MMQTRLDGQQARHYAEPFMKMSAAVMVAVVALTGAARAQRPETPLYRVFLVDGQALVSYGEWARVDNRLVFSMPVVSGPAGEQLHLVSIPADRVDWKRTEQYAHAIRAAQYAATRGEEDFARLSADVARALNEVALISDPAQRLTTAERARRALTDWPGAQYGYRMKEVRDIVGVLDEVISGFRASAGLGRYELALMATTEPPPTENLLPPPDQTDVVQQLMSAAMLVDTPVEKVSLLQTVVGVLDRAVDLLPDAWSATIRATALGGIAEEKRIDAAYARLRTATLTSATRYAEQADVRSLARLRTRVLEQDGKLGHRRAPDITALIAAIEGHLDAARRLRLAQDQWLLRVDRLRAYQRASSNSVAALTRAQRGLDDIRALAGPRPERLRPMADALARESRLMSRLDPPAELAAIHAVFRSACELALNAVRLRLDAAEAADLGLALQASSAAAGALMLLAKAKSDLDAALRPPTALPAAQ